MSTASRLGSPPLFMRLLLQRKQTNNRTAKNIKQSNRKRDLESIASNGPDNKPERPQEPTTTRAEDKTSMYDECQEDVFGRYNRGVALTVA